ncbi:hypothetical protein ACFQ3J_09300 [Paenibacillus provencensis]|uniref:Phospholipid phosphatase n=1 Tax=Paenibacillus provencensis TaxID=441151 RepID=A0ABW3PSD5_9BACL|nr:hypothetical protein [Paenibacillus sp. MER 78]MCM3128915.1 hypothetical protein [Paenibacillus sp. MER 78]
MDLWIYSIISIIYLILVFWMAIDLSRMKGWFQYPVFLLLVALSLTYDNGIIAAGETIGEGKLLVTLSSLRFWLHAFVTPTLVLVGYDILKYSGARWGQHRAAQIAAWLTTAGLIVYQIVTSTLYEMQHLTSTYEYGVLRYTAEGQTGPPIMVIIVGIILLVIGIIVLMRQKWAWLLVGTGLLFIGQLIPIPIESSGATNIFELILILSIWLTIRHQNQK